MNFFTKYEDRAKSELIEQIDAFKQLGFYPYFKELSSEQGPIVNMDGREVIMLGSNNYLSMTINPQVKEAAKKAIDKYGVGSTGSRLLNGTMDLHVELENRLAKFLGKEAVVIFSTGMQANLGALSCFLCKDDWVISDKQNHASIIDGIKLSGIPKERKLIYEHDNMEELERCLKQIPENEHALIVSDGIFSMEGTIAQLDVITELAEKYGAGVYVDDAHAVGVLGPNGRGTAAHYGVTDKVDIIMGTFSKSFASIGGYIAGSEVLCQWVKHKARALIYSASSPPSALATVLAVLDIIEKNDSYRQKLWANTKRYHEGLTDAEFDTGKSQTPILPIIVGDEFTTFGFFKDLLDERPRSVYTNPVRSPAVDIGRELLRTTCQASFEYNTIDEAIEIITKHGKQLGVI
ncbi:MAG TPA: aminotransferase class I/II-fold pyridoxal phosphate-dependent enzyme [Candidatus Bathyarchaeia archaeon]|nr:aminotransferase class I/II-fold pyridoxal phosphate-dependent enzyme [Candidatus Bathyarchaeia archaeon]